jgi:hypothetical protein
VSRKTSDHPTSQARIDANRANALKSTGPVTEAGKSRARMNAWKHGICARHVCVRGEDHEQFEELAANFRQRFNPADPYEFRLVDQLIVVQWNIIRLRFIQASNLEIEIERLDLPGMGINPDLPAPYRIPLAYKNLSADPALHLANRELTRLSREFDRIHRLIIEMRREIPPSGDDEIQPVQNEPNQPAPHAAPPRPSPAEFQPARNEPNAALAGHAILLAPKPQPAEPAPPLRFFAA